MRCVELRKYKVNESLDMVMGWEFADKLFVGEREQRVGRVVIELDYRCDKLIGKCLDEGRVIPEVVGPEDVAVRVDIDRFESSGKLRGRVEKDTDVVLDIGMGRGDGKLSLTYVLKIKDLKREGKHTIHLTMYYETKKGERKILGEPVRMDLYIVKPFVIERFSIEPSSEYYAIGDPLKLVLEILSEYDGNIIIECGEAVRQERYEYRIEKGSKAISIDTSIVSPKDELSVLVKVPAIEFSERVTEKINVMGRRVLVEPAEVAEARLGREAFVSIKLTNLSRIHQSQVAIDADIYGYRVGAEETLSPGETKVVRLETPILTSKSFQYLKGEISVLEKASGQKLVFPLELAKPSPLPVELEIRNKKIETPTNGVGKIEIYVHNNSELSVGIVLTNISSRLCSIKRNVSVTVVPYGLEIVEVEVEPTSPGNEKVALTLGMVIDNTIVEERTFELEVEVRKSFSIKDVKVVHPSKTSLAVKNQRIELEVKIEAPYGKVDIVTKSPNMIIESQQHQVYPPETLILVSGKAADYCESIKIYVSDGLIEEEITVPISVRKPLIECEIHPKKYYVGVKDQVAIRLANPFEVPLVVEMRVDEKTDIEVDKDTTSIYVEQLGKKEITIGVTGLREGKNFIRLKIVSIYVDEASKVAIDTCSYERDIELGFSIPISIEIPERPQNRVPIPYPLTHGAESISSFCNIGMLIKNISDIQLLEVSIEPHIIEGLGSAEARPKTLTLSLGSKEKVEVIVLVPTSYRGDLVKMLINAKIGKYVIISRPINVYVNRYLYSLVEIEKEYFEEETCVYPRIDLKSRVYALVPVTESENVCGKPIALSTKRHTVLRTLYKGLNDTIKSYESPWELAASIVFKKTTKVNADFMQELKALSNLHYDENGITIVPALMWILALEKIVGYSRLDKAVLARILSDKNSVGLFHVEDGHLYKVNKSTFYHKYLKFAINGDSTSAAELKNHILESIKNRRIDPLYLLYILYGGERIQYGQVSDIVDRLYEEGSHNEFLMCLVLTDVSISDDVIILTKLETSLSRILNSNVVKKSTVLTLSLLFSRIILENMKNITMTLGGVNHE